MATSPAPTAAAAPAAPEKKIAVFRHTMASCTMYDPKGRRINFIAGRYATDDPALIAYLDSEIDAGNQYVRRGTEDDVAGLTVGDPLAALRKKFLAEFVADKDRIIAEYTQGKDMGASVQGPINAASSKDINAVTAGR